MKKISYTLISVLSILVLWLLFSIKIDNAIILPNPFDVFSELAYILTDGDSLMIIAHTLTRLFVSLGVAFILGVVLGLLGGLNKKLDLLIRPVVTVVRTLPVASIIIVLLIWFGYQKAPYVITILVIMPVIYESVVNGLNSIDNDYHDVISVYYGFDIRLIKMVYLPLISPFILTSVIQSLGLGIKVLVMAEMLSQTRNSIGYIIYLERLNIEIARLFAWTIVLILIVSIIELFIRKFSKGPNN